MATVYSGEVSVGSYNRIRIKCDYSGTSATLSIEFKRTSSWTDNWRDDAATLTFNGQEKGAAYNYYGTVGSNWVTLVSNISGYSISTSGGTYNWRFKNPNGGVLGCSGTITIPAQSSPPTGPSVSVGAITWDSISITGGVSSWGSANSNTKLNLMATIPTATTYSGSARAGYTYTTTDTSKSIALTNLNKWDADGGLDIVGCTNFKAAMLAESTNGNVNAITSSTYWTPPAPTTTITKVSETSLDDTQNRVVIRGVGTTANNASGAKVHRIYRVSINGTWGNWQNFDPFVLDAASVAQETSITVPQNSNIIVEVKERYYEGNDTSQTAHDSVATQYSFTSAMAAPACSSTWNDVRDTITVTAKSTSTAHDKIRIEWGYTSAFEMGTLADSAAGATTLTGTISNPNHGTGQKIYYRAKLLKTDSTWVTGATMQRSVLNPVLGVCTFGDGTKQYIVDIREKKKNQSIVTAAWQNGRRIVKN